VRVAEGERCVVLDDEARRCPRLAVEADYFHGDGELSYPKVSWVRSIRHMGGCGVTFMKQCVVSRSART